MADEDSDPAPPADAGGTIETAAPLGQGGAEGVAIDPPGDRDFYELVTEPGVTYAVQVRVFDDLGPFDPVVRVWDAGGRMLAESDDLPYALTGKSPGMLIRMAGGGPVYVEILDKADWRGEGGYGAPSALYDIDAVVTDRIEPNEDTNADNDTVAQSMANADAMDFDWYLDPWVGGLFFVIGGAHVAGDPDVLSLRVTPGEVPVVWQVSTMDVATTSYRPRLTLYDEAGRQLATTTDPSFRFPGITLFDAGISYPITSAGRYFVRVEDDLGGAGPGAWYALLGLPAPFGGAVPHDLGFAETADEAVPLALVEGPEGDRRVFFQTFYGALEDFGGTPDPWDTFEIDEASGAVAGAMLTVRLETAAAGSVLDAKVSIYDADGALLAEATDEPSGNYADDPAVIQLPLDRAGPVRVRIEPENGAYGPDAFYLGVARLEAP